MSSNEVNF